MLHSVDLSVMALGARHSLPLVDPKGRGWAAMEFHEPVLVDEIIEALGLRPGQIVVDGTLGTAGHALVFVRQLERRGILIGLDRDPAMLAIAKRRLEAACSGTGPLLSLQNRSYTEIGDALAEAGVGGVDAMLLDLGLNSLQIEDADRGFSFVKDGPLDGRFNPAEGGRTVADLVNTASERDLADWLYRYADERYSRKIASAIVRERKTKPFTTTLQLAELVRGIYPPKDRNGRIHPATRTFQALRIVANDELAIVERGVRAALAALNPGGRLAVITFHSGEDRLVKNVFREVSQPRPDPDNPYSATTTEGIEFELLNRNVVTASEDEADANPRSRSAKLRVIRRREVPS